MPSTKRKKSAFGVSQRPVKTLHIAKEFYYNSNQVYQAVIDHITNHFRILKRISVLVSSADALLYCGNDPFQDTIIELRFRPDKLTASILCGWQGSTRVDVSNTFEYADPQFLDSLTNYIAKYDN